MGLRCRCTTFSKKGRRSLTPSTRWNGEEHTGIQRNRRKPSRARPDAGRSREHVHNAKDTRPGANGNKTPHGARKCPVVQGKRLQGAARLMQHFSQKRSESRRPPGSPRRCRVPRRASRLRIAPHGARRLPVVQAKLRWRPGPETKKSVSPEKPPANDAHRQIAGAPGVLFSYPAPFT